MRKLLWFTLGFGAACGFCCYVREPILLALPVLALLTALFSGSGEQVTAQLPGPETALEAGSQVLLYLDEAAPQAVTVPDLTGMTPAQANEAAAKAGVTLRFSGNPDFEQAILVQFQDIAAGTPAEPGCTVTVTFTDPSARD